MKSADSPPPRSVSTRVAKGAGWVFGSRLLDRSIGFISTLVLARLLVPSDFGIVAMATALAAVLEMLTSFKFDAALIQRANVTASDYNTAWTWNVAFGLMSAMAMVALADPLADFYHTPDVFYVVLALAANPLLHSVTNVWLVEYRRNLEFHQDFMIQAWKKAGGFLITIPAALLFKSYWALVAGMLAGSIISAVMSYRMHPRRPRFSLASTRSLMSFSVWTLIDAGLSTARLRVSHFVLGRLGGADQLGLFFIATDVSTVTTLELVMPINRAIYPAYARMAADPRAIARGYLAVLQMIALVVVPTTVGIVAVAHLAIPLLLGPNWVGVIPLVTPMALFGLGMALQTNAMPIYWAVDRPRLSAMMSALLLVILVALLVPLTALHGVFGAALASAIAAIITVPATFFLMARLLRLKLADFLHALWRPAASSLVMFGAVETALDILPKADSPAFTALALLVTIAAGALTYVFCSVVLWRVAGSPDGAESFIASRLSTIVGAVARR